ncbi:MAG: hypothetical protein II598_00895 [Elusimicrobia bacterium]|nr:hypothetical protein [Elusimicrobiota bacterium]
MKRNLLKLFSLQNIIAIATIFFGVVFWFYTINGLPKQIESHEQRISKIEKELLETKTKTDMILQAVYEIRSVLLKK